jgi:hypothetical protein
LRRDQDVRRHAQQQRGSRWCRVPLVRAEKVSGTSLEGREELKTLLQFMRAGDTSARRRASPRPKRTVATPARAGRGRSTSLPSGPSSPRAWAPPRPLRSSASAGRPCTGCLINWTKCQRRRPRRRRSSQRYATLRERAIAGPPSSTSLGLNPALSAMRAARPPRIGEQLLDQALVELKEKSYMTSPDLLRLAGYDTRPSVPPSHEHRKTRPTRRTNPCSSWPRVPAS